MIEKDTYVEEAKRRIAHLSYKLEGAETRIRQLEFDNAELQRWVNNTCLPRLIELGEELSNKYHQKKYRDKNWSEYRK